MSVPALMPFQQIFYPADRVIEDMPTMPGIFDSAGAPAEIACKSAAKLAAMAALLFHGAALAAVSIISTIPKPSFRNTVPPLPSSPTRTLADLYQKPAATKAAIAEATLVQNTSTSIGRISLEICTPPATRSRAEGL